MRVATPASSEPAMPRFQVYVLSFSSRIRGPAGSAWGYVDEAGQDVAADARVSEAKTFPGPEGTIASEFRVSATDEDEAVEIGREVFRAALLKAGAPVDERDWRIDVGARLIDEATGYPVQPAGSINVVLRQDIHTIVFWDDLRALQRRLDLIREPFGLRDNLMQPLDPETERIVMMRWGEAVALHLALEEWSVDANADEAMPRDLVMLRSALRSFVADLDPATRSKIMKNLVDAGYGGE